MARRLSYVVYPIFVLRAPGLPLEALKDIPFDKKDLDSFLSQKWKDESVRASVRLGSESLFQSIEDCIVKKQAPGDAIATSFLNYYTRFSSRSTPFGLFSGVNSGKVETKETTEINLNPIEKSTVSVRLDTEFLVACVHKMLQIREIQDCLIYRPSGSMYATGHQYRLVESHYNNKGKKQYNLSAFDQDPVLEVILDFSRKGKDVNSLIELLQEKGYSKEIANDYIRELIKNQLLVSNLEIVLTGIEYQNFLYQQLRAIRQIHPLINQLLTLIEQVKPFFNPGSLLKNQDIIINLARKTDIPFQKSKIIQADLLRGQHKCQLSEKISNQVLKGIRILKAISDQTENDTLADFRKLFSRRFGDREVPLSLVMDQESGIGLNGPQAQQAVNPSALLDDLPQYGHPHRKNQIPSHPFILSNPEHINDASPKYIELSKTDINRLNIHNGSDWPHQFYTMVSLFKHQGKTEIYMPFASGGHPGTILGRFGFLPDQGIEKLLNDSIKDEIQNLPDVVFAEIQHLPEDRTGNILQRPSFYDYEIPFMAQSVKALDEQLPIEDILVSVPDKEVILRSKKLDKRVIPKLNNAHNYSSRGLPLYEFLVKVGVQNQRPAYQISNQDAVGSNFLPGVKYGNIHFRLPEWRLQPQSLQDKGVNMTDYPLRALATWVSENKLPTQVVLKESDQDYYIDWSRPLFFKKVWERIKHRSLVRFQLFPFTEGSPVYEDQDSFANQIVLCFRQMK